MMAAMGTWSKRGVDVISGIYHRDLLAIPQTRKKNSWVGDANIIADDAFVNDETALVLNGRQLHHSIINTTITSKG